MSRGLFADEVTCPNVCELMLPFGAANRGAPDAVHAVGAFARYLARGCALLVQLLDPEALILAGGLAQENPLLLMDLESELSLLVPVWERRGLAILTSSLGYHAGVLGAAALAQAG